MIILAEISTGRVDGVVLHLYGSVVHSAAAKPVPKTVRGRWVVGMAHYAAGTAEQLTMAATNVCDPCSDVSCQALEWLDSFCLVDWTILRVQRGAFSDTEPKLQRCVVQ
jgi:hypothetical protein